MNKCKDCRCFRMRYDNNDNATIPYCTEMELDVESESEKDCFQEYRNID